MDWMEQIREFAETRNGKRVLGGLGAVAVLGLLLLVLRGMMRGSDAAEASNERTFICSETGKSFHYELQRGAHLPVHSPYSGKDTGYPAELCYWTADGQVKKSPDAVLLKSLLGERGPTFCPVCKRLVVMHNCHPKPGDRPPPTEADYAARHGGPAEPADAGGLTGATNDPAGAAGREER